jgi:phosphoribosylformylglycinamidine synthase
MPLALVIRTAGTNCDLEMVRAFEIAGATARRIHMDRIIEDPSILTDADLLGFAGGFSYGDDCGAGRVQAVRTRDRLWQPLRDAARRGTPMIGACNGFQMMVQVGLLPGPEASTSAPGAHEPVWPDSPPQTSIGLAENVSGRYEDRWASAEIPKSTVCIWTRGLAERFSPDAMVIPCAHGEGRVVMDGGLARAMAHRGQIAMRYADGHNFNGSADRIAGVCDASGRIFGLMPHPERFLSWDHHPWATRLSPAEKRGDTPGIAMFRSAVELVGSAHAVAG